MSGSDDLNVEPEVLNDAAAGINGIIGGLSEIGIGETGAVGRGFSLLMLSPDEAGSQSVQKPFEEFTERWSWGIRYLVQAANSLAETLGLAAGRFHTMEKQISDTFKIAWTNVAGNPHLSSDEIAKRSFGETFADNPLNNMLHPDYSKKSFEEMYRESLRHADAWMAVKDQAAANVVQTQVGDARPGYDTGAAEKAGQALAGQSQRESGR